jgi:hypothetical protein
LIHKTRRREEGEFVGSNSMCEGVQKDLSRLGCSESEYNQNTHEQ